MWLSTGPKNKQWLSHLTQRDQIKSLQCKNPHKAESIDVRQNVHKKLTLLLSAAHWMHYIELYYRGVPVNVSTLCRKQLVSRGIICFLVPLGCCSCCSKTLTAHIRAESVHRRTVALLSTSLSTYTFMVINWMTSTKAWDKLVTG